jgi:hypothetical protein
MSKFRTGDKWINPENQSICTILFVSDSYISYTFDVGSNIGKVWTVTLQHFDAYFDKYEEDLDLEALVEPNPEAGHGHISITFTPPKEVSWTGLDFRSLDFRILVEEVCPPSRPLFKGWKKA